MTFVLTVFVLIFCLLSTEINSHILVIAPPLLSHMIPTLELAKQLSAHCHVTYLISASKIKELEHKGLIADFNNSSTIDIVGLIDGNNEFPEFELQDSQVSLNNITEVIPENNQSRLFCTVLDRMSSALNKFFQSNINTCSSSSIQSCPSRWWSSSQSVTTRPIIQPINMIIVRSFTPLPSVNLSVPLHLFLPSNLGGVVNYIRSYISNNVSTRQKPFYSYLQRNILHVTGFICNSLKEFDERYVDEFHRLSENQAPIRFVGPIVFNSQQSSERNVEKVISWLDKQPVASVIYIAFGTAIRLPPSAIDTIAHALSHHSFIWSLKTKLSLPSSLQNLDSNRQLILEWTPQRAILAHPSISFFLSHGGWNSLIEGMLHGQAILAWPFFADQFDNTLQLVNMGMAQQVSTDLQSDIEHMFNNRSYAIRAKQIQQMVIKAQEISSKEQIADIVRLISNEEIEHDEF